METTIYDQLKQEYDKDACVAFAIDAHLVIAVKYEDGYVVMITSMIEAHRKLSNGDAIFVPGAVLTLDELKKMSDENFFTCARRALLVNEHKDIIIQEVDGIIRIWLGYLISELKKADWNQILADVIGYVDTSELFDKSTPSVIVDRVQ